MKNCKIKRVIVPYVSNRELTIIQAIQLFGSDYRFKMTGFTTLDNIKDGLTYLDYNPDLHFVQGGRVKFVKFTPEQFLKHYLK